MTDVKALPLSPIASCAIDSFDILLQPLFPLSLRPTTRNFIRDYTIEHDRRRDMHTRQPIRLDLHLDIIRDLIPTVQASILTRLVTYFQQPIHLAFIHAYTSGNLRESLVRRIPRFVDHVDVKEALLLFKECLAESVELGRVDFLHSIRGFMDEG